MVRKLDFAPLSPLYPPSLHLPPAPCPSRASRAAPARSSCGAVRPWGGRSVRLRLAADSEKPVHPTQNRSVRGGLLLGSIAALHYPPPRCCARGGGGQPRKAPFLQWWRPWRIVIRHVVPLPAGLCRQCRGLKTSRNALLELGRQLLARRGGASHAMHRPVSVCTAPGVIPRAQRVSIR